MLSQPSVLPVHHAMLVWARTFINGLAAITAILLPALGPEPGPIFRDHDADAPADKET